jgi:hypothetical protein
MTKGDHIQASAKTIPAMAPAGPSGPLSGNQSEDELKRPAYLRLRNRKLK